jgi:hypothetical protein
MAWDEINLKGAIDLGAKSIQSLLLVNGAAAAGLLTFYGNALSAPAGHVRIDPTCIRLALLTFGGGVFLAILCSALAWYSQLCTATSPPPADVGAPWRVAALIMGLLSAGAFFVGLAVAGSGLG